MSECSAKNLGLKATNQRRGSFASGQRSWCQFFFKTCITWMLQCYWLFSIQKNFATLCSQLAMGLVTFLPTGSVRVAAQ